SNMLGLLTSFPQQFQQARQIGEGFDYNFAPTRLHHIIFAGMGGSAIGGDLIIASLGNQLKFPAAVVRHYSLPPYTDQHSLVIVSSYSGNTEESLSCYEDAKARLANIICITSGGELAARARRDGVPFIAIPGGNPPRTALAYLSIPVLVFFKRSGIVAPDMIDIEETIQLLIDKANQYAPSMENNRAMVLAQKLIDKIPILYSSVELLQAVAMRWKGQLSENSKVLAFQNAFPELNHNEIVGWERRADLFPHFQIIYLRDHRDHIRIQRRMEITRSILEPLTLPVIEVFSEGHSRLARLFSLIYLGDMVSYYLAIFNGIDPTTIDKIQLLKDRLRAIHD
ncbi:MAG: bifunctional phosphoglucose/phosphomannose isomerase, partial [candidate division KSB1 bacterium]|nr:bifunctional phosphoglucose/phosphomannose isomerase [candidate division KSB1 bacterium]